MHEEVCNMLIQQAIQERIIQLCKESGITINRLATISGITQSTLQNTTSGRNNSITLSTLKKICDGLDISIKEFFNSPLFDNLEQEIQ